MSLLKALLACRRGARASGTFNAVATPNAGSYSGNNGSATSDLVTCTPSGGTGPYTYLWRRVSGSRYVVIDNPESQSTTFTGFGGERRITAVFKCVVTDSLSATADSNTVGFAFQISGETP